jgi:hypothetical protein
MLDRYAEPAGVGSHAHPMQLDELLEYLKNIDNFSLSPWVALAGQTEAIGDPATPSPEQIAILRWLGKALEIWEKQSPLEGRVAAQVRRLKPLSAALALTDPTFLQPGAHPLHQLLDSIQARAIGWQARLNRVGAILEQQVTKAVEDSRRWFENPSTSLADICAEFSTAAERDQARAKRMIQRVVEAEAGKVKTAAAKQEAARMINAALEKHPAPPEIGGFLKGPWYTSAQLLLLKFGADSEQWEKMSSTTRTLLDSFQNTEEANETRRQHIFEVVTQLPKEMRRWLLSLHHDTEAVNESMGLVEFAHLRILRRQPMELLHIPPIVVEGEHVNAGETQNPGALKNWHEGQWFSVEIGKEGVVRAQLVLKVEQSQQLLFTNLAGIKVLQLTFSEFQRLITQDKVKALNSGASFSLCLAHAVGIDSVEILDALANALAQAQPTSPPEAELVPVSRSAPAIEPLPVRETVIEAVPDVEPDLDLAKALEALESELELTFESESEVELESELELGSGSESELEPEQEPDLEPETAPAKDPASARDSTGANRAHLNAPSQQRDDSQGQPPQDRSQPAGQKPQGGGGYLSEQADAIKTRGGYFVQRAQEPEPEPEPETDNDTEDIIAQAAGNDSDPEHLSEQAGHIAADQESSPDLAEDDDATLEFLLTQIESSEREPEAPPGNAADSQDDRKMPVTQGRQEREIDLPMGAWLGFHDGETPLMARLAVYDLENDHYIFVNRKGVKMRQVGREEMLNLIDKGLVDVLEALSNFRDDVTAARKELDQE